MTYNVLSGTLSLYTTTQYSLLAQASARLVARGRVNRNTKTK